MNYDTDRWIIINYPPAAGGKFIAACLMLFDNVAHWSEQAMSPVETVKWYKDSLPNDHEIWFKREIDTPWVLPASRLWNRGGDLSKDEFWKKFNDETTPWFRQCHQNNDFIVDFWHKQQKPCWWSSATWINVVVDSVELYKDLLFAKVFKFDLETKTVEWLSQAPGIGRPATLVNKSIFQNKRFWDNIESRDQFYEDVIVKIDGFGWNFSSADFENHILLSELFDVDELEKFLLKFENVFGSKFDTTWFREMHQNWVSHTVRQIIK